MKPKALTYGLFVSLGGNLFLAGVLVARLSAPSSGPAGTPDVRPPAVVGDSGTEKKKKAPDEERGRKKDRGRPAEALGPPEMALLRSMVHIMGGRGDERVVSLKKEKKGKVFRIKRQAKKLRQEIQAALVAEPFDEKAFSDALAQMNAVMAQGQEQAQSAIVHLAGQMSPEERARLAEVMKKMKPPREVRGRR